ncbi:hybrid sensor histidine kinase/response regulator [Caldimonas brevitalea]|uniref:histidine kinase n=1 Tax=Caldimonas brevitalea TaxID=413882 RepID=A0A0G3BJJ7_9BURK|nr:ATP-binding protein [Caldimonas brevitalea]AKJ26720.1 chemotaxis protein methyltransferase [Caldimonas brevitalea]
MERRVFVLAPSGKDAVLIEAALQHSRIEVLRCAHAHDAVQHAHDGIGALVVAEEALKEAAALRMLQQLVDTQASWSDLPVLLLSQRGRLSALASRAARVLGNVTVLERPTQVATLVSAVRTALRTRERQYEVRHADVQKDMFLATLAHELRNPLAPLSNALHLLQAGRLSEQQQQWATGVMQRQVGQLSRLVDDLLDVARITRGKIVLQKERLDLRDAIQAAVETSLPQIDAMRHRLSVDLPPQPVWADADRTRIAQCVANLLTNAAKYTPRQGEIRLSACLEDQDVLICVQDNGIGFPPHEARRLFDVFAQVDGALGRAQGGLGLGLSIVKALVEMHGGSVHAESEGEGHGARFEIRLPVVSDDPGAGPGGTEVRTARGTVACRVLVVDDNRDSADSMAQVLRSDGHEVHIAYNGHEALRIISHWKPQLALLDIGLPDLSGHELARRLREQCGADCPVLVALTGWGQPTDVSRSAAAGFEHHLTKPADLDALLALVDRVAQPCDRPAPSP